VAKSKTDDKQNVIEIEAVSTLEIGVCVLGTTPLLMNRLAAKARQELLMPAPKKNAAERAMKLKHDPFAEYRDSVYRRRDDEAPTRLLLPGGAFRKAVATAALDVPGSSKAQIGRLVRVVETDVDVYGVPQICCMITRNSDMRRTPDVRTRAILPEWCCSFRLKFAYPLLKERSIIGLLAAAGDFTGVGDGRNEKGSSLSCGCFQLVADDHPDVLRLRAEAGRAAQDAALQEPAMYDVETEDLLAWFVTELGRRDHPTPSRNSSRKQKEAAV
jgi:hypothetical protein